MMDEKTLKKRRVNWLYAAVFAVVAVGCYAVLRYAFPTGDDLFYGRWTHMGFAAYWQQLWQHYFLANGRTMVHAIDVLLLASDATIAVAQAFIAALLGGIAAGLLRLGGVRGLQQCGAAALLVSGVFLLPPLLTRQSVYWITGAMNYVFPMAVLVVYWLLLRRSLAQGRHWAATALCGLVASVTVEQIGMMAFGVTVLLLFTHRVVQKKKLLKWAWLALALTFVGMASVCFAPSMFYRSGITAHPNGTGLELVRYNVRALRYTFLFGDVVYPIHLLAMTAVPCALFYRAAKKRSVADGIMGALSAAVFAAWFWLPDHMPDLPRIADDVPAQVQNAALLVLAGYLLCMLYAAVRQARDGAPTALYAWILAVGSQVMMLVSPTVGPRTLLCAVFMLLLAAVCLTREIALPYVLVAGCVLGWHWGQAWVAAVAVIALALWLLRKKHAAVPAAAAVLCCLPLLWCAWTMLDQTHDGYRANAAVNAQNRAAIAAYDGTGVLALRRLPEEEYAWVMPYHNDYYDLYFKTYYGLPRETEITWQ